jgi:hypothetical protein
MSLSAKPTWATSKGLRVGPPDTEIGKRYPDLSMTQGVQRVSRYMLERMHGAPRSHVDSTARAALRRGPALLAATMVAVLLALAVGSRAAAATSLPGTSARACAQAFDNKVSAGARARVARHHVVAAQIFATALPSCVITFQLAGDGMLTASAAWTRGTASAWKLSVRAHGRLTLVNARWVAHRLTATGSDAATLVTLGPPPTTSECVGAWNARIPARAASLGPGAVLVQPMLRGTGVVTWDRSSSTSINGPACTVSVLSGTHAKQLFYTQWDDGRPVGWHAVPGVSGVLGNRSPNADLGADGRLTLR